MEKFEYNIEKHGVHRFNQSHKIYSTLFDIVFNFPFQMKKINFSFFSSLQQKIAFFFKGKLHDGIQNYR